jgi:hypothetical protein
MKIGDLVLYAPETTPCRWIVTKYERMAQVVTLTDAEGNTVELPEEADKGSDNPKVLCNPSKVWQMLTAPVKSGAGPFVKMVIPPILRRPEIVLEPMVDWIQSDIFREGGSFFVRPELKLRPGVLILATHKNGSLVRITVPSTIGTLAKRKAAVAPPPPKEEFTRFSRLLKDDDD